MVPYVECNVETGFLKRKLTFVFIVFLLIMIKNDKILFYVNLTILIDQPFFEIPSNVIPMLWFVQKLVGFRKFLIRWWARLLKNIESFWFIL